MSVFTVLREQLWMVLMILPMMIRGTPRRDHKLA
jgi:hypothetical protein